ncbi:D-alanyl-D-alanine carboxypeptidase/D-alanyl-D-alanine-endopeptidase [soil metagenome]
MNKRGAECLRPAVRVALVVLVPAVVLAGTWRWAASRTGGDDRADVVVVPAQPPVAALTTPLLSFRRVPDLLARTVNRPALAAAVDELGRTLDDTSCLAVGLDGEPVAAVGGDRLVIPASNQKILVAAVALEVIGPDATFTTEVRSAPLVDGVVAGDLYLVGGGDPLLTSGGFPVRQDRYPVTSPTSLDALADGVVAAGVARVDGAVVGDGRRYDDEWFAPSWDDDVREVEAGPYDALMVNDARSSEAPAEGKVDDPAVGAAAELTALLAERGVDVVGAPRPGVPGPETTPIASVTSAPMSAVVAELLGTSDDNTAELLVKELGVTAGSGGTRTAGLEVIRRTLESWGVPAGALTLADGSGLSDENRLTCSGLVAVLGRGAPDGPLGAALPVAGRTGTLADVLTDSPVTGRLRAKTGTLGNAPPGVGPPAVKALAGYLPVDGGGLEFALIMNSPGDLSAPASYMPVWESLVGVLASYPPGPAPSDLAPR